MWPQSDGRRVLPPSAVLSKLVLRLADQGDIGGGIQRTTCKQSSHGEQCRVSDTAISFSLPPLTILSGAPNFQFSAKLVWPLHSPERTL